MRVFFDLEFTNLNPDADLISAGFITEYGKSFYIEFDGISKHDCSPFVQEIVWPLLRAPGVTVATPAIALQHILAWLLAQDTSIRLISDSHWDSSLMGKLIKRCGGMEALMPNLDLNFELLSFRDAVAQEEYKTAWLEYFLLNPEMRHHALHDATAMRLGAMRAEGFPY